MGKVFAIAGGKGGVGKTTTTVNLARAFAAAGYDTVAVDADLGMANVGEALGVEHGGTVHSVLADEASVVDAVASTEYGFDVVRGTQSLDAFASADPANFRAVVGPLKQRYDVVLLDTAAGLSHEVTVPLGLADKTVLVTTPDVVAIKDAAKTGQLAKRVDGDVAGVLVTNARNDGYTRQVVSELANELLTVVPADERLVTDATVATPGSPVAQAYNELAAALLGTDHLPEPEDTYAHVAPDPPTIPAGLTPATVRIGADGTAMATTSADDESESAADAVVGTDGADETGAGDAGADAASTGAVAAGEADAERGARVDVVEESPASVIENAATEAGVDVSDADAPDGDDADTETDGDDEERRSALGRLRRLLD
ncbi:MinD/ParA family protein [Halomarina salina]|uniref:MinD/ParA family protein n=1 Tax=Halomarina salina TaxID=1872699 RepID=A0ABD5RMP8_9EURY|nr:AAA family ATPase [Halomarina salina]